MTSRFISNLVLAVLGATFVAMSLAFHPEVVGWLALGLGCSAVLATLIAFPWRGRGAVQRLLDGMIVARGLDDRLRARLRERPCGG